MAEAVDHRRTDQLCDVFVAVDLADVCGRLGAVLAGRSRASMQTRFQPTLSEPFRWQTTASVAESAPGAFGLRGDVSLSGGHGAGVADSRRVGSGANLPIVGPTGSGKSTLFVLLLRHYAPDQGRIVWGGHAIDEYQLNALRGAVSWVPQEAFLFSATLEENIALARSTATRAESSERGARGATRRHRPVPAWLETMLGERGITLSGGRTRRGRACAVDRNRCC